MDNAYYGHWLPVDISTHGHHIDSILAMVHWFMLILFIGWGAFFLYTLWRFSAGRQPKADYKGVTSHYTTYIEVAVAVFEVFVLVGLSIPVWADVKGNVPMEGEADIVARVVAEQFAWNFHYPGEDGVFGRTDVNLVDSTNPLGIDRDDEAAKDDVTTINQFHFPVGKKVLVYLSSKDVIHSFHMNVMRVKQDAIPGMTTPVWFEATQTGDFEISCAQLCGLGHYRMKGFFKVETDEEYAAWMAEQAASADFEDSYY
ncbi:MAG: cytochrome c oxidase subunit 2 [Hyphomicrobiaceae bacterium]|jgi:cytochrome c oxidase subunit 2